LIISLSLAVAEAEAQVVVVVQVGLEQELHTQSLLEILTRLQLVLVVAVE
jgi:hypothetical protein